VLILDNATLVDLDAGELRPGHFVCIDGDTIVSVDDRRPSSEAAERIDLAGRCLLPGLIDAHYHATLTDTNPANLRDVPTTLMTARAANLLRRTLERGFTTVRDIGGARVQKPRDVLLSATRVNAEILGQTGRLGVIAPGALADLIAVAGNPLADLGLLQNQGQQLTLIMKNGAIVKRAA
jgi:imidazolonepropionase-like amidohydrolase